VRGRGSSLLAIRSFLAFFCGCFAAVKTPRLQLLSPGRLSAAEVQYPVGGRGVTFRTKNKPLFWYEMRCKKCKRSIRQKPRGRIATFCSLECRKAYHYSNRKELARAEWYSPKAIVEAFGLLCTFSVAVVKTPGSSRIDFFPSGRKNFFHARRRA
jgi:hypothetical protein